MKSILTDSFLDAFGDAPPAIREKARKAYSLWRDNPRHPSLQFKRVSANEPIYSARIDDDYRVLGLLAEDTVYWFWIGKHDAYMRLLRQMQ